MGQERELGILTELGRDLSARSTFVEVVGEPGIGKSALLAGLAGWAAHHGQLVLRGRAAQFERDVPFQVFVDALDDYLDAQNPRLFDALPATTMDELAGVYPSMAAHGERRVLGPDVERYRAHHAVRSLLELLAVRMPLVLELDDVHWADESSQELLSFLLRRPARGPVLVCVAYRVGQAPPRLRALMQRAVAEGDCVRVELGPLAKSDAAALVGEDPSSPTLEALYAASGGNPFYIQQLARTTPQPGALANWRRGGAEIPASVLASIDEELAGLDTTARRFLEAAAVTGDPFDLDLACAGAALDEADALTVLDGLLDRQLVRPATSPRTFHFRHPIVHRSVYDNTPLSWRLGAHRLAAAALAARGATAAEQAHHVQRFAKPGDLGAVEQLVAAGTETMSRAPGAAAHWFEAALRLLPGGGPDPTRLTILLPLAVCLASTGRLVKSRTALREVLAALPPSAIGERVSAAVTCSMVENFLSRHDEARELLVATLRELPTAAIADRATVHLALGNLGALSNDWEAIERHAELALSVIAGTGNAAIESAATSLLALHPVRLGRLEKAPGLIDHAAALADSLTDAQLAVHLETLAWLFSVELFAERIDAAIRHSERAVRVARAMGLTHLLPLLMMGRNWSISFQGRLLEADSGWQEMLEICLLTGNSEFEAWALTGRTFVATERGDWRRAVVLADRTVEASAACRGEQVIAYAHVYAARLWLEQGDPNKAKQLLLTGAGGPELEQTERIWRVMSLVYLARSELELGNLAAAEQWTRRAEELAEDIGLPGRRGWALTARARLLLHHGQPSKAADTALEAVAASAAGGFRIDAARARVLAGHALTQAGCSDHARAELQSAYAELDAMGALHYRDEAARALRRSGVRVIRATRPSRGVAEFAALSEREREVAELVAEGRTNRDIARLLYISEKTVEKRLSRVFEKLDVSGRAAVGARLSATRPEPPDSY